MRNLIQWTLKLRRRLRLEGRRLERRRAWQLESLRALVESRWDSEVGCQVARELEIGLAADAKWFGAW